MNNEGTAIAAKSIYPGMEEAARYWESDTPGSIAFYTGNRFPQWKGSCSSAARARASRIG